MSVVYNSEAIAHQQVWVQCRRSQRRHRRGSRQVPGSGCRFGRRQEDGDGCCRRCWQPGMLCCKCVSPANRMNRTRCRLGCWRGWIQGTMVAVSGVPPGKGQFWGLFLPHWNASDCLTANADATLFWAADLSALDSAVCITAYARLENGLTCHGGDKCGCDSAFSHKRLSYRRCVMSVEILPIATQRWRNYLYDKSWTTYQLSLIDPCDKIVL